MNVRTVNWIFLNQEFSQVDKIALVSSERDGNVINFVFETKINNVILIIVTNCGKGNR